MEVEVDRTFDTETYEMNEDVESISTISVEEVDYEIEEQPFIKSNYNWQMIIRQLSKLLLLFNRTKNGQYL